MSTTMPADRVRTTFDVEERIRRTLNANAARRGISVGQVITELVEAHLAVDLASVDQTIADDKKKKPKSRD